MQKRPSLSLLALILLTGCVHENHAQLSMNDFAALLREGKCDVADELLLRQEDPDQFIAAMYNLGICREKDALRARSHYVVSAARGNAEAMYAAWLLTAQMDQGVWTQEDREIHSAQALALLEKSAALNNWRAEYALSVCYAKGACGLPKRPDLSQDLKERSAAHRPKH